MTPGTKVRCVREKDPQRWDSFFLEENWEGEVLDDPRNDGESVAVTHHTHGDLYVPITCLEVAKVTFVPFIYRSLCGKYKITHYPDDSFLVQTHPKGDKIAGGFMSLHDAMSAVEDYEEIK